MQEVGIVKEAVSWEMSLIQDRAREEISDFSPPLDL